MATKECRTGAGGFRLLLLGIATLLGLGSPALAASGVREIAPIGASGTAAFNDVCKDGGYMIGVRVYLGDWVDYIEMVCSDYRPDLTWRPRFVSGYGGGGGSPTPKVGLCKDGWILTGLRMEFTKYRRQVRSIYGTCRAVASNTTGGGDWVVYPGTGAGFVDAPSITCHDGEAAAGLSGRYGDHVNALGLNCRKYPPKSTGPVASDQAPPRGLSRMLFCQAEAWP
ncbi:hypothetical protein AU467_32185 [Mesorhizobium loti]|uniref:Uncharacterized protein n=1 Tax=Rhizobium loti TaxID=381 RepID=A0A117N270_RHILI|nr:hypothetical protein AU467_32185 [Mesorhizobium loti]